MKRNKYRIFIGLGEVAGYFNSLTTGFQKSGYKVCFFQFNENKYYRTGNSFMRLCQTIARKREDYRFHVRLPFIFLLLFFKLFVFVWAVCRFNVFIFAANSTFFKYRELWILKCMRKKIVYVFLGSESRPDYISGNIVNRCYKKADGTIDAQTCFQHTFLKAKTIRYIEKYADICINHPPCAFFHRKPFIKWLYIGFPFPVSSLPGNKTKSSFPVKIVHAPSNPQTKGSEQIKRWIGELKTEGLPIEYIELVNQPNEFVLRALAQCDFVIDELYSDIPLGGLGTEAAALGKPVINGGYYTEYIESDYDSEVIPPAFFCMPHDIKYQIKELILNPDLRLKKGEEAYNFIRNKWSSQEVSERYIRLLEGTFPSSWVGDPNQLTYVYGYGQDLNQYRRVVKTLLDTLGENSLCISDKPGLMERIKDSI